MLAWAMVMNLVGGDLRWQAPPEVCPGAAEVRRRMDAAGGSGDLVVDGRVVADADGWTLELTITLGDVSDSRTLHAERCDALAESVVLLVAMRLDEAEESQRIPLPDPIAPEPPPEPPPEPEAEAEPEPASLLPAAIEPEPPPTRRASLPVGTTLGLGVGAALGSVPTVGVPTELGIGHAWPRLRVSLRGRFHAGPARAVAGDRSMRVRVGTAGPRICGRLGGGRLEFPLCGEVAIGGSRAYMQGPDARDRGGLWLEAGAGAGVAWFFHPRWALTGGLSAAIPVVGTAYDLGEATVWAPAAVGGRAMLGVEFLWPIQIATRPENSR